MRRFISILCAVCLMCTCFSAFAVENNASQAAPSKLLADSYDVLVNSSKDILFTCEVESTGIKPALVTLYNSSHSVVANLFDNGTNGDKTMGDGVYSAYVNVSATKADKLSYYAVVDGAVTNSLSINAYRRATAEEFAVHDELLLAIDNYEDVSTAMKIDSRAILDYVHTMVKRNEHVVDIKWENDYSFSFKFDSGLISVYARWDLAPQRESEKAEFNPSKIATDATKGTWTDPDAIVFRPFRNSPYQGDFDNEFYSGVARNITAVTGGVTTDLTETNAYPGNLPRVAENGFFIVDSHGITSYGASYMILRTGNTSNYDYYDDMSANRIISSSDGCVGVTGSFFTKYVDSIPDTFFHLAICYGLATTGLSNPLLSLGARTLVGYDESVSFTYDFELAGLIYNLMLQVNPDTGSMYTVTEAITIAKNRYGSYDPYTWNRAVMHCRGDADYVIATPSVDVEGVTIDVTSATLYTNNTLQLNATVTPADATDYSLVWSSDNEAVATVTETGYVTAFEEGNAIITCTVTDNTNGQVFTADCTIECGGWLPVSGITANSKTLDLYLGSAKYPINVTVLPENASDKSLTFESSDTSVATVDDFGFVTPVSLGTATITITSVDGGHSDTVFVSVIEPNYTEAVNKTGGALAVVPSDLYPWEVVNAGGRYAIVSSNVGIDSTTSSVELYAGELPAGATIMFDWLVRSEYGGDILAFYVNGQMVHNISGYREWATYTYDVPTAGEYTFAWKYEKNAAGASYNDYGMLDEVDIVFEGQTHTVTFAGLNGEVISTQEVAHGMGATAPDAPEIEGYEFIRWDKQYSEIRADVTINAIYEDLTPPAPQFEIGDVNCDGVINVGDAVAILRHCAGLDIIPEDKLYLADCNGDTVINVGDAVVILRHMAGLE